jgi:hypothetical protein
MQRKL